MLNFKSNINEHLWIHSGLKFEKSAISKYSRSVELSDLTKSFEEGIVVGGGCMTTTDKLVLCLQPSFGEIEVTKSRQCWRDCEVIMVEGWFFRGFDVERLWWWWFWWECCPPFCRGTSKASFSQPRRTEMGEDDGDSIRMMPSEKQKKS